MAMFTLCKWPLWYLTILEIFIHSFSNLEAESKDRAFTVHSQIIRHKINADAHTHA